MTTGPTPDEIRPPVLKDDPSSMPGRPFEQVAAHPSIAVKPPTAPSTKSPVNDIQLQRLLLEIVDRSEGQVSVRELVLAASARRRVTYKQVKTAAETLTAQGRLLRGRAGTANLYQRNGRADTRTAHDIAELLATTDDPSSVVSHALKLLQEMIPLPAEYRTERRR